MDYDDFDNLHGKIFSLAKWWTIATVMFTVMFTTIFGIVILVAAVLAIQKWLI